MVNSPTREDAAARLSILVKLLGYQEGVNFAVGSHAVEGPLASHLVREALYTIGIAGAFVLSDGFKPSRPKPIVYVASATTADELRNLRKDVWSQGAVPFLIVEMPEKVMICHAFSPPDSAIVSVDFPSNLEELPEALWEFSAKRIASSLTWRDFDLQRDSGVDNNLVAAIEALNDDVRSRFPILKSERDLVNALIGKFIYIYVLVDRGIISEEWLAKKLIAKSRRSALSLVDAIFLGVNGKGRRWSAKDALAVFDVVDEAINGSVFLLKEDQRRNLPDEACRVVHSVVRCGEQLLVDGVQLGFFNVSFKVLRTETISAIYERFVSVEDFDKKKHEGVFYTPPHLADHVLDRVEAISPLLESSRFVDPAAGSGIFLVGAFRRLMERHAPDGGWSPRAINEAKRLLLDCIHGVEKHRQAANVARFSLYLTLLDYVGRAPIEELIEAAQDSKFLPDLSRNVVCADSFGRPFGDMRFSHVVGNPPWTMIGGQKDRTNASGKAQDESEAVKQFAAELLSERLAYGHNRLSDLFTWLAVRRYVATEGIVAFVLPARSLVGRGASNFSHCLASKVTVRWVGNLSHLRRKLFVGVEAPACVLVAQNREPDSRDRCDVYRPLLSSLPTGKRNEVWSLLSSSSEIQTIRSRDLESGPNGWFVHAVLGELDRRTYEALRDWSVMTHRTLGDFLRRSGLSISKGGSPNESGVERSKIGKKPVQLQALSQEQLLSVTDDFRGWFSGNAILIPRGFNGATYHREPLAYPSTFNAVIPEAQYRMALHGPIPRDEMPFLDGRAVRGFLSYVNSMLAQYFAALFGASYWMDKARLEKNDLLALPCPFLDTEDGNLLALGDMDSVDEAILDAMEAGTEFRSAFDEFVVFRRHFANAQIPTDAFNHATDDIQKRYRERLDSEIRSSIGRGSKLAISIRPDGESAMTVGIGLGKEPDFSALTPKQPRQFLANSIVAPAPSGDGYVLFKSAARQAWTLEQAVADATAVFRAIRDRKQADL